MRLLKIYSLLLILSFALGSCQKLLNPEKDNHSTVTRTTNDPVFAEGLLMTAYLRLPNNSLSYNDVATSDAVSSDKVNQFRRMATGEWSSLFNPVTQWDNCNSAILYINDFLNVVDTILWKWTNTELNKLYIIRLKGEAYALRGLLQYHLLLTTGGVGANNELLGIPIFDKSLKPTDNFNIPRANYKASISKIYADLDKALEYLTMNDYVDITSMSQVPPNIIVSNVGNYNTVFGKGTNQRISGRMAKALKARVALLEASPAFSADDPLLWAKAANYAAAVLNLAPMTGISGLDPLGHRFFEAARIEAINLTNNIDQKEMIWRTSIDPYGNGRERNNYPPSIYGLGNINPSQNLVDAFPDVNGYPITDAATIYSETSPYSNRDPRLGRYIVYNGSTFAGKVIKTGFGGGFNAKDSVPQSTRTGYYLRKLLREDISLDPAATSTKKHYEVYMRYTELFLIYAEAANEAWGPDGTGTNGFSARDVIRAIRSRGGITQPDAYLATIASGDKAGMRTLIRNERRIELCFESFRFWDLRRWNADLTEKVRGVQITGPTAPSTNYNYSYVDVEDRVYDNDFMRYGPLPEKEVLKFPALIQNKGW